MDDRPCLLLTPGDVAGIGPEITVRACAEPDVHRVCRPIVIGDAASLQRALKLAKKPATVERVEHANEGEPDIDRIVCIQATDEDLRGVAYRQVSATAGQAAFDFLSRATDLVMAGEADGIVTAPLNKKSLHAAGLPYPGHTEILAERTRTPRFGMMLYYEHHGGWVAKTPPTLRWRAGAVAVSHVTLHVALREIFDRLRTEAVLEKIELTDTMLTRLLGRKPRIGVCGLNPHASDGGLFGAEEAQFIAPAIEEAKKKGIEASGPWPSDTLFARAFRGEFDGVVAMYHDQGHIPFKLMAGFHAVNISLGLPLVRTSVAHGTAYDIAGKGIADPTSMIEAIRIAAKLARTKGEKGAKGR